MTEVRKLMIISQNDCDIQYKSYYTSPKVYDPGQKLMTITSISDKSHSLWSKSKSYDLRSKSLGPRSKTLWPKL